MIEFIFTYLAIISFGVLLTLVIRALPRVKAGGETEEAKRGVVERFIVSDLPVKFDQATNRGIEKLFRKLKIFVLRADNYLTDRLKRFSLETKEKPKIDFKDIDTAAELGAKEGESGELSK